MNLDNNFKRFSLIILDLCHVVLLKYKKKITGGAEGDEQILMP